MSAAVIRAGLAAAAVLMAAAPAVAQTEPEMIGTYRVKVEPAPGSVCPPGEADFEVLRFGGNLVEISLDHTKTVADWDPARNAFKGTIPFPDGDHLIHLDGSFTRGPDRVNLVVMVRFPPERPCEARLSGSIPATASAPPPPPPPLAATPSPTTPPVFGVSANGQPVDLSAYTRPAAPAGPFGLKDAKLLGWVFLAMLVVGVVVRVLRRKGAATASPVAPPPPAPEPPAPPKPAPKPRAKAKPKPARTEEEDELGDG